MFREKEICNAIRTAYICLFPDKKERKQALSRLNLELVAQGVRYRGETVLAYFKLVKNKPKTKGNDDLDDYDYGEDSEDADDTGEDEIWETEDGDPDEDDPDAGGGGDEESETPVK